MLLQMDYEYIFSNVKWTTVITAAKASGCTDHVQGERSESQKTTRVQTLSMENKADGNGRTLTQEGPALSPGWTTMHHAIFGQNLPPLSRSHGTGALEKRRESDPPNSGVLTQDESRSLDLSNESNTIDHIPEAKSKPDWISGTVFSPDTHWNDHIHEDVQLRFEGAVDDLRDEICSTELEEEKKCNMDPEKGGAVGQADIFDHQLMNNNAAAEKSWKRDNVVTTVQSPDCELSSILWDNVLVQPKINAVLRGMVPGQASDLSNSLIDPVQGSDSEIRQILMDNVLVRPAGCEIKMVHHSDYKTQSTGDDTVPVHEAELKMSSIFGDAVHVLNSSCELSDVLGDTVSGHHTNSEINDMLGDMVPLCLSELILAEKFHQGESEIDRILGDHPSCDAKFNLPPVDLQPDSGANLLKNDATQMLQDLTVRAKTDAQSACRVSEDVVTVDTTTNSSDAGQLMPSYRPTMSNQEGIDSTSKGEPVELWVDACPFLEDEGCNLDKWGPCPSSCPPLTCADNTKALFYPSIERWSSSDSWASALSDWIQSVSVAPEDFSSTKPLTNYHNQSSTAIQDEKSFSSSAACRKRSDGAEMLKDEGTHVDVDISSQGLQGDGAIEDFQEDTTSRNIHRPSREESDALTGGNSEKEGVRNDGALSFSGYSTPQCVQDPTVHGESDHLTHEDTDSCVFSDTLTTPISVAQEDVDSIMPLTPINIGTLKEEQDASRNLSLAGITDDFKPNTSESGPSGIPPRSFPKSGDVSSEKRGLILPTSDHFVICQENRVAYVTLDLEDILNFGKDSSYKANHKKDAEMPRKTHKTSSKNRDKSSQSQTKTQENVKPEPSVELPKDGEVAVIETIIITEKVMPRTHSKKKKKQAAAKPKESEPLLQVENGAKPNTGKPKAEAIANQHKETVQNEPETVKETEKEPQSTCPPSALDDDSIKRRRIGGERAGSVTVRTRPQLPAIFRQRKEEDVKQKVQAPAEAPRVLTEIEAAPVAEDPQSVSLWCRFSPIMANSSVTWMKEDKILSEEKKRVGEDAQVTLLVLKASSKDLGLYRCSLTGSLGSASTSDYHLTSEVLMELIIPDLDTPAERREVDGDVEDVSCAPLLFKDDILTDQYFGEQLRTSIVTEKSHFGEGMHRKAFRATMRVGMDPAFSSGHSCVLKVHNSIGYGANSNDELVQRNYSLAVEECYVQNTAREYIKAYTDVAKSAESFGEVPEIIPIFLVHRPSNAIPYATLEEELIGDFVKYSVKDGKEINLMRRDSEAGQKCCAFQHWVYVQTDGNLLVTDMQGVGMKLTDVGIATCKKGYKGFKGNCSTSFIDQFKALHQCNRFCELLGLSSLQPKPKRTAPPKPKAPHSAKKKPFSAALKGKS